MANDEKVMELLEKMYVEMKQGFKKVNSDAARLEDKFDTKINALFDGYKQVDDKITRIEDKINNLSDKVDQQEIEINVVKQLKKVK